MGFLKRRPADGEEEERIRGFGEGLAYRHRIEETIGEVGGGYYDLIENSRSIIQSVRPDGHYFYVNRAWRETLGYEEGEITSLTFLDVIHPDSRGHCTDIFRRLMGGECFDRVEFDFVTRDGDRVGVRGDVCCRFEGDAPVATRGAFNRMESNADEVSAKEPIRDEDIIPEEFYVEFRDLVNT